LGYFYYWDHQQPMKCSNVPYFLRISEYSVIERENYTKYISLFIQILFTVSEVVQTFHTTNPYTSPCPTKLRMVKKETCTVSKSVELQTGVTANNLNMWTQSLKIALLFYSKVQIDHKCYSHVLHKLPQIITLIISCSLPFSHCSYCVIK